MFNTVLFYDPCCTLWRACVWGPRLRKRFPAGAQHVALPAISLFLKPLLGKKERGGIKKNRREKKKKKKEYGSLRACIKITAIDRQVVWGSFPRGRSFDAWDHLKPSSFGFCGPKLAGPAIGFPPRVRCDGEYRDCSTDQANVQLVPAVLLLLSPFFSFLSACRTCAISNEKSQWPNILLESVFGYYNFFFLLIVLLFFFKKKKSFSFPLCFS